MQRDFEVGIVGKVSSPMGNGREITAGGLKNKAWVETSSRIDCIPWKSESRSRKRCAGRLSSEVKEFDELIMAKVEDSMSETADMAPVNRKRQIASKILRIHRPLQKSDEVDSSLYPHWGECSTCLIGLEDFYLSPLFASLHSSIFGMINFPMLAGRNRHMALRNTTKFPAQANLHGISKKGSIPHERISLT